MLFGRVYLVIFQAEAGLPASTRSWSAIKEFLSNILLSMVFIDLDSLSTFFLLLAEVFDDLLLAACRLIVFLMALFLQNVFNLATYWWLI